jgi:hypothetical protein
MKCDIRSTADVKSRASQLLLVIQIVRVGVNMGSENRRNEVIMKEEEQHLIERSDSNNDYREEEEIDGGWGWLVVCACFCTTFVLDGIGYSFGMFIKPLKHEMRESNFGVASIGSVQVRFYHSFCVNLTIFSLFSDGSLSFKWSFSSVPCN